MRNGQLLLTVLAILTVWMRAQGTAENPDGGRTAPPIQGTVELRDGKQAHFTYYFDHNALKDCVLVGGSLIALSAAGNLLRFDANTLGMTGQVIVPGRATTITLDARDRVLIGTQEGQISEVDPTTFHLKHIATTAGRIVWLSSNQSAKNQHGMIVAVVDNHPEVLPWPGEPFRQYDDRSAHLAAKQPRPYFVNVYANGSGRSLPFQLGKNFAIPNSFLLDSDRLWMGTDKGEWGGECSYMDLRTGKVHVVDTQLLGVLGFLRAADGRIIVYGGMDHIASRQGYIARIKNGRLEYIRQFESDDWHEARPDRVQQLLSQTGHQDVFSENVPHGPVDLILGDVEGRGFWVVSAHTLYHTDSQFSQWMKIVDLGGRWYGGRRYSVGNTPTVNRLILDKSHPENLLVAMGRDGLARVSAAKVERMLIDGQLEWPVIDIWKTSTGTILLGDDDGHTAWHLAGNQWRRLSLFPDRSPSDQNAFWSFAEPFGNEYTDVLAFCGDNVSPGERDLIRLDAQGSVEVIHDWKGASDNWDTSFLMTSEGGLLKISGNELWIRQDKAWRGAGESHLPDPDERMRMLAGRRYVSLAKAGQAEIFLDFDLGDFVQLTRISNETYRLGPAVYEDRTAPAAVFDAVADRDDWFLIATAHGLFRFHPHDGQRELIPSPNPEEEIKSMCRDKQGRLWAAGDRLYTSSDEGKHWEQVRLPMVSTTFTKRVRPDPTRPGLILALYDEGVVLVDW